MPSEPEILLQAGGVGKRYTLRTSFRKRLAELFRGGRSDRSFEALTGIDLTLRRGECLGIIGRNGAGKSTLLSLLAGIRRPTSGTLERRGRTTFLLDPGYGFDPEFTGRENIVVAAMMQGMSRAEAKARTREIIEFADIGEFIDQPVKKYSSGMFLRLAFAVTACTDAEIRLVDEALAVGDVAFQQKCFRFLEEHKKKGALVLISHDLNAISTFCEQVLVLDRGRAVFSGPAGAAVEFYTHLLYGTPPPSPAPGTESEGGLQSIPEERNTGRNGRFTGAALSSTLCRAGDTLSIRARAELHRECPLPIVGYHFSDRFGKRIFGCCTKKRTPLAAGKAEFSFDIIWPDVAPGEYTLTLGIGSGNDIMAQELFCWATDFRKVTSVKEKDIVHGVFNVPMEHFTYGEIC